MYTARKDEEAKGKKKTVVDALPEKVQKIAHSEKKKANSKVVEELTYCGHSKQFCQVRFAVHIDSFIWCRGRWNHQAAVKEGSRIRMSF